jgi:alpha-L-arabinofuranosidase
VGSLIDRQERYNVWGYMVDNGLGYYEYLQMCEDLEAQALFCINCGMDVSQDAVPANAIGPWVQEALDAIEFANGGTNTVWGAQRAAMGHAAPFNLQYLEIGNENNGSAYNANYAFFYDAIKSNYPAMHLIADSQGTIPTSAPVEMVDQHYYSDPAFFESAATMYDSYSRNGPKVFVGEYAVTSGSGNGNLAGALGEAAFMTGLERNSDVVRMASYAPLFCNLNNKDWNPDLIYFTGTQVYGTPSYYVQQMFSLNRGTFVLPTTVSSPANPLYVSSSLVPATSQLIVKVVNVNGSPVPATIAVGGVDSLAPNATLLQLTSTNAAAENSLTSPTLVFPTTNTIATAGTNFSVTLPANSLCIFKLQAVGFHVPTNLLFSFSPTLREGQIVPSTVLAQEAGTTNLISLSGNYAIVYSSADTNIATVDGNGEVAGLGVGTTTIYAAYAGLTATQTVQVVAGPPTTLTHRYSFSNGTANDLVGKANGVLHGNATITGGGLLLPNTTGVAPGTDYLQLPPGILTNSVNGVGPSQNDPAVTIEAWATVAPAQYAWANLFDFGAQDASGDSAYDIHACVHASDGDTVTGISDSDNANVDYQYVDCGPGSGLDGSTNVHVVCVFDPPHGVVAIYTNAALVGEDSAVTISMAGVEGVRNIIGADNWPDAGMKGSVQEFRIYNGALHPDEIAATQLLGPAQVLSLASPAIMATVSGGQLILSWPLASAGFTLMSSTSLASGTWLSAGVQPQIMNNNHWQVSVPVAGSAQFFRLQK